MKIRAEIKLRDWQNKAFDLWLESEFKGIFSIVTGGGKNYFRYLLSFLSVPTRFSG